MTDKFTEALILAVTSHQGQKDKCGQDYIFHPVAVSSYCVTEKGKIAALLHDIVEDTETTLEDLRSAGFDNDIVAAIDCLTKRGGEELGDYLKRVASSDIAVEVKFADMRHNSDQTRWPQCKKEQAAKNSAKYKERAKTLYALTGGCTRSLMSEQTYRILINTMEKQNG